MSSISDALELADQLQQYRDLAAARARSSLDTEILGELFWDKSASRNEYEWRSNKLLASVGLSTEMFFSWFEHADDPATPSATSDTFLLSALDEMYIAVADLLSTTEAVVATGHAMISLIARHDEHMREDLNDGPEWARIMDALRVLGPTFWREVSGAIGSACGFWDRAGQLINFVFFNIREFDRETFPTVIEKLNKNFVREEPLLGAHESWERLWKYTQDEKTGYASLAQRRNTLVHSVSLRRTALGTTWTYTQSANALERKRAKRLPQDDPKRELEMVVRQARAVVELRLDVLAVCQFGIETMGLRPQRFGRG